MTQAVYFAHGNGFPASCYRQMMLSLSGEFDCFYIDKVGHDSEYSVTDNWQPLVTEVIDNIKARATSPVIAIGHSFGGVLNVLAAIQEPSLFRALVLLDTPLWGRFKSRVLHLSKWMGFIDHVTPASRTRKRRTHWSTQAEAMAYFKSRKLFEQFTDACLQDYIDCGLQRGKDGYTLCFDADVEYQIYRTIPHGLPQYEGQLKTPTALIYGNKSTLVSPIDVRYMQKHYGIRAYEINGTHMFPMEHPQAAAEMVLAAVKALLT